MGFLTALTLLFIGLKLGGLIDWAWVWVLSPLWAIPAILATLFCGYVAYSSFQDWRAEKRRLAQRARREG